MVQSILVKDIDFTTSETVMEIYYFMLKEDCGDFLILVLGLLKSLDLVQYNNTLHTNPDNQKDDVLDFEFKFYDNDNNEASASFQKLDNDFEGGNTFIGGGSNLVTGSVFVGKFN